MNDQTITSQILNSTRDERTISMDLIPMTTTPN